MASHCPSRPTVSWEGMDRQGTSHSVLLPVLHPHCLSRPSVLWEEMDRQGTSRSVLLPVLHPVPVCDSRNGRTRDFLWSTTACAKCPLTVHPVPVYRGKEWTDNGHLAMSCLCSTPFQSTMGRNWQSHPLPSHGVLIWL